MPHFANTEIQPNVNFKMSTRTHEEKGGTEGGTERTLIRISQHIVLVASNIRIIVVKFLDDFVMFMHLSVALFCLKLTYLPLGASGLAVGHKWAIGSS